MSRLRYNTREVSFEKDICALARGVYGPAAPASPGPLPRPTKPESVLFLIMAKHHNIEFTTATISGALFSRVKYNYIVQDKTKHTKKPQWLPFRRHITYI